MMRPHSRTFVISCMILLHGSEAAAQRVAETRLPPADGRVTNTFASINSIRELIDGRVLVSDERDGHLYVADFRHDGTLPVGSRGRGPAEYVSPGQLFELAGDSTLMVHVPSRRALLLSGTDVLGVEIGSASSLAQNFVIRGAGQRGQLMVERIALASPSVGSARADGPDSTYLVLLHRETGVADTVARVREAARKIEYGATETGGMRVSVRKPNPVEVKEPGLLAADGWLAVVRREPYRVEWRRPDGTWINGPVLPTPQIDLDEREKKFVMNEWVDAGLARRRSPDQFGVWPKVYPPFATSSAGSALLTRDGKIAIVKPRTSTRPEPRYDVVDRSGRLTARIVLNVGETIVGFGNGTVYVAAADQDGLLQLSRHPWGT